MREKERERRKKEEGKGCGSGGRILTISCEALFVENCRNKEDRDSNGSVCITTASLSWGSTFALEKYHLPIKFELSVVKSLNNITLVG